MAKKKSKTTPAKKTPAKKTPAKRADSDGMPKGFNSDAAKERLARAVAHLKSRGLSQSDAVTYLAEVGANRYIALQNYAGAM